MKKLLVIALALLTTACGVKSELAKPDGTVTARDQPDPSRPPYPLGR